jgi:transcriptional/translational regulatory protein YebC/TACO1
VSFMFERVGSITYPREVASEEEMFEAGVECGAANVISDDNSHEVITDPDDFSSVRDALAERFGDPQEALLTWKPQSTINVEEESADGLLKLLDALEDNDDVQRVSANFEIADDVLDRLTG